MSIVYGLSLMILLITVILIKKSEKKLDILTWVALVIALLICYQTFISYVLTMCNIPVNLLNLTIVNVIISTILGILIFRSKQIQEYEIHNKDILAIILIFASVILIACIQFKFPLNIKYMMTDAAAHYLSAEEFYKQDCLLLKAEGIETNKCMMPGAYTNIGILFKVFAPYIGEMNLYKIFIIFDIFILMMSGILIYFILKRIANNDLKYILAIGVSILYVLGYPLNSMLSGYSYLSVGIVIISAILLFMQSFERDNIKNSISIISLFLLCMQVFFSYYLFVPLVYGTLGIYYIIYFKRKHNKIWNLNMLIFIAITLVIPTIIGFTYQILPEMTSITNIQTLENIKTEGYIYRNMITNFLLLIPFAIYYFYRQIKCKELKFITLFSVILVIYLLLIGLAMKKGMISTYYFYKIHFILWLAMWVLFYKGAVQIIENIKIGDIIVKTYMIWYVGLLLVSLVTVEVGITKDTITHEKITDVMDIYGINKTLLLQIPIDFTTEELQILDQVKENDVHLGSNNVLIIANQRQEFWFWGILHYKFKENLNYETTTRHIELWNNGTYEYLIYFNRSDYYNAYKDIIDLEGREVIFENESGAIIKNK